MTMIKLTVELLPEERQPKHSYRYGYKKGDAAIESVYIKRSAIPGKPPKLLEVVIHEAD